MTEEQEREFYEAEFTKYMEKRGQAGGADPADSFREWLPEGKRRSERLDPWLRPNMRVLEIGSATGYLLDTLKGEGRTVTGVEPGDAFRSYANSIGIETHPGIESVVEQQFDLILSYYVVEHLRDPVEQIGEWFDLLEPGGHLAIEVPNVDDALVRYYQVEAFDRFYWQRAHYFNYSHKTLTGVLNKVGFDKIETVPVQRYDISNHIHWLKEGKPGGKARYVDLLDERVNEEYARVLRDQWYCDTVFAVATKNHES